MSYTTLSIGCLHHHPLRHPRLPFSLFLFSRETTQAPQQSGCTLLFFSGCTGIEERSNSYPTIKILYPFLVLHPPFSVSKGDLDALVCSFASYCHHFRHKPHGDRWSTSTKYTPGKDLGCPLSTGFLESDCVGSHGPNRNSSGSLTQCDRVSLTCSILATGQSEHSNEMYHIYDSYRL